MTGSAMEYKISWAVQTGRQHLLHNIPCQDQIQIHREGGIVCAALADGAGSRESSHIGAACVTRTTAALLCREFSQLCAMTQAQRAARLLQRCLEELERQTSPIYELASTLLFFAADAEGTFLAGHLGDGVFIQVQDGEATVVSPPENGFYQNETHFITAPDAPEHLRLRQGRLHGHGALLMMSDGVAQSLYQHTSGIPARACATIARWLEEGEEAVISQALAENMEQVFSAHSTDDLSLAVIAWKEKS